MLMYGCGFCAGRRTRPPGNRRAEARVATPESDLERLYLQQKLSASKIAIVYGLKYARAKTAESTLLYQLRRNGIARRDPAAHIRKVAETTVDELVRHLSRGRVAEA